MNAFEFSGGLLKKSRRQIEMKCCFFKATPWKENWRDNSLLMHLYTTQMPQAISLMIHPFSHFHCLIYGVTIFHLYRGMNKICLSMELRCDLGLSHRQKGDSQRCLKRKWAKWRCMFYAAAALTNFSQIFKTKTFFVLRNNISHGWNFPTPF